MAAVSGATGDITVGATALELKSWNANLTQGEIDITDKADGGWINMAVGLKQLEGSWEADFEVGLHDTGTFPFPFATAAAAFVCSMTDGVNDGGSYSFNAFVFGLDITSPVDGVLNIKGNFKSSGVVTYTP